MANDDDGLSAAQRWVRTFVEEFQRFRSLGPLPGSVFGPTPAPPEVMEEQIKSLAKFWPVPQSRREGFAAILARCMAGEIGSFGYCFGTIPEPEASHAAAIAEAEGFAAATAYAVGRPAATDEERYHLYLTYVKLVWMGAYRYAFNRHQAAGTPWSGPPALPPPTAASVDVTEGPMLQPGPPSVSVNDHPMFVHGVCEGYGWLNAYLVRTMEGSSVPTTPPSTSAPAAPKDE